MTVCPSVCLLNLILNTALGISNVLISMIDVCNVWGNF